MGNLQAGPTLVASGPPQRGWWSRNWKWFVPTLFLLLLVIATAFVFGVLALVFGSMKASEPYKYALDLAQHSPAVIERLGEPIEAGMFVSGNIQVDLAGGHADLAIPISGPKGKGTVYVVAEKIAGRWEYRIIEAQFEGDPIRVNLRPGGHL